MIDLVPSPRPATLAEIWERTVRLGTSIQDVKIFKGVRLAIGANLLRHECKAQPKTATVQLVATTAVAAPSVVLDPDIGSTFLTIHSSAAATVDVVVWI